MRKIRKILGPPVLIITVLFFIFAGIYDLKISLAIVKQVLGPVVAYVSLLVFPVPLALAPWYALLAWGDFHPLVIVYGTGITATILFYLANKLIRSKERNEETVSP